MDGISDRCVVVRARLRHRDKARGRNARVHPAGSLPSIPRQLFLRQHHESLQQADAVHHQWPALREVLQPVTLRLHGNLKQVRSPFC